MLETWCGLYPDTASAWLNRGYCLVRLGKFAQALTSLERSLELDPGSDTARGWRGKALAEVERSQRDPVSPPVKKAAEDEDHGPATATFEGLAVADADAQRGASETVAPPYATVAGGAVDGDWAIGSVVDARYEVKSVTKGGMGTVTIAYDRELRRMIAIKTPLLSVLASTDGRARFRREAEAWVALGIHPNICCAYYLQELGGLPRLFMEYVDGGDLGEWLKTEEGSNLGRRLDIAIQVASGLDYTHNFRWTDAEGVERRGVVHRDIKPANVLLTSDGVARVTDFGLVRADGGDDPAPEDLEEEKSGGPSSRGLPEDSVVSGSWQTVTEAGNLVGTPPYMAPELWGRNRRGSVASDIYAFGCVLYQVFCGRRPLSAQTEVAPRTRDAQLGEWMRQHLHVEPPDPAEFAPGLDTRLAALMRVCVAKDPAKRPQSFALLRSWLVEIYEAETGSSYPRPEPRRTRLLADSLNNRGVSFVTLGSRDRALSSFREALETEPGHLEATFNLGLLDWQAGELTDADLERSLAEARRSSGDPPVGGLYHARLRLLLDDPRGATDALRASPESETGGAAVRRELGLAVLAGARETGEMQRYAEARRLLEEVVGESESDLSCVVGLASACAGAGDEAAAHDAWMRARLVAQDLPESLAEGAVLYIPGHLRIGALTHQSPVQCLVATPGGGLLVRTADAVAAIWNLSEQRTLGSIDLGGTARQGRSIAIAGDALVACVEDGSLTLFDLVGDSPPRAFGSHPGVPTCVTASEDGRAAISGGSDRKLRIWDVGTGECVRTLDGHEAFVTAIAWHPRSRWVVSASADATVRVWDLELGRVVRTLESGEGPIQALALDPSGRLAVCGGQSGLLEVWELASGRKLRALRGHAGAITAVAIDAGRMISGGDDGTVRVWSLETGGGLRVFRLPQAVRDLVMIGGRAHVAHGSLVTVLEIADLHPSRLPLALSEPVESGELGERESTFRRHLETGRSLIEAGRLEEAITPLREARAVPGYEQNREALELWDRILAHFPKRSVRSIVELRRLESGSSAVTACVFKPDGSGAVGGGSDGRLRVLDASTGAEKLQIGGDQKRVTDLAISGDGRRLVSAGQDGTVRVWDPEDGRCLKVVEGHEGSVQGVDLAPDGRFGVSAGSDGRVLLFSTEGDEPTEVLGRQEETVSAVALSSDGRFVVSGGWDRRVTVWSPARKAELQRMEGHDGAINSLAVSPDCRLIASAADDGTVRLWDRENEQCWRVLSGHEGPVLAVAFSPDARFLLSGGKDATLRLWDLRTGACVRVVEGHAGPIWDVALSCDGRSALSAGSDGTLRLWSVDWEPELPESGGWDDRVVPFLEVVLRRREGSAEGTSRPHLGEAEFEDLLADLARRGYGWLAPERVRRELDRLARERDESRGREQQRTQELVVRRQRRERVAPVTRVLSVLTRNLGLKVAAVAALVILGLLAVMSLRTPKSEEAAFHHTLYQEVAILVRERNLRLQRGMVLSFQGKSVVGPGECVGSDFEGYLELALYAERLQSPRLDPRAYAEDTAFREGYARAIDCLGGFSDPRVVEPILRRVSEGMDPYRHEDLLSIMVRVGARSGQRIIQALSDPSAAVRHLAALTLIHSGDRDLATALVEAVEGDDLRSVEAGSYVLIELIAGGVVPRPQVFPTIRRLSRSIEPGTRRNAVRTLVLFEDAGPPRRLLEEAFGDSSEEVALAARQVRDNLRDRRIHRLFGFSVVGRE